MQPGTHSHPACKKNPHYWWRAGESNPDRAKVSHTPARLSPHKPGRKSVSKPTGQKNDRTSLCNAGKQFTPLAGDLRNNYTSQESRESNPEKPTFSRKVPATIAAAGYPFRLRVMQNQDSLGSPKRSPWVPIPASSRYTASRDLHSFTPAAMRLLNSSATSSFQSCTRVMTGVTL